jgi:hypothetical protein
MLKRSRLEVDVEMQQLELDVEEKQVEADVPVQQLEKNKRARREGDKITGEEVHKQLNEGIPIGIEDLAANTRKIKMMGFVA